MLVDEWYFAYERFKVFDKGEVIYIREQTKSYFISVNWIILCDELV
jgi:hypothetical protein